MLKLFNESVQAADVCDSNARILHTLYCLYGVFGIVQYAGEFGLVSSSKIIYTCIMMHQREREREILYSLF